MTELKNEKLLTPDLTVNEAGHLAIAGYDAVELAETYGTALFVLNEQRLRDNAKRYVETLRECFGESSLPLYASKALSFTGIYRIVNECGMGTDIVSPGELYTAVRAGFPLERAFFHGNNKTDADIRYAMDEGIGYFIVDNREELEALSREAASRGITQKILLRITPGIDPHTHKAIVTGSVDSKFGQAIVTGQAFSIVEEALRLPGLTLCGFHCHIGSQIFEAEPFCDAAKIMLDFIADVKARYGYEAKMLNLGGGYGVRYVKTHPEIDIPANIRALADVIRRKCAERGIVRPTILMEPGRSIVADAVTTLYTVGSVKEIPGVKNYVSVDGGMADNPRYALYQSEYTVLNASRAAEDEDFVCSVGGRCCESGDLIQEGVSLARPVRGDVLAVLTTGAYNYSMASNYNRLPRPAILSVGYGEPRILVRRETYEDLCRCDV